MICIWCLDDFAKLSLEHGIPEALGCPPDLELRDTTCAGCNNRLGTIDQALLKPFEAISVMYGVPRKKGRPPTIDSWRAISSKHQADGPHIFVNGGPGVVDAEGTMVSNTYTINDLYGSRVTIKGTGVLMNDEMDDFAARPGRPNLFGLVQGERNKVEGGKRPLSSMTPTIVLRKDGSVWFAVGARGGPRIISAVIQSVINVIDHEMGIQEAIDAPRIHHQWLPDQILQYIRMAFDRHQEPGGFVDVFRSLDEESII